MKRFLIFIMVFMLNNLVFSNDFFQKGKEYYFSGNFEMAKLSFEKSLRQGFTNEELILMLGNSYMATGEIEKSISTFVKGLELFSDKSWVFEFNLGYAYYVFKDYTNSFKYLSRVIESNPSFSKTYWFGGMASLRMLDIDSTINLWERYLQIDPNGEESDNIRKAIALLKDYGTNAIPEIIADLKGLSGIDNVIEKIKNGYEIKQDKKTLEDTSFEGIEK
ncbi:MAG: tetratricopeptide repeat protein [Brevinematia bacterium]